MKIFKEESSRRDFIKKSAIFGAGLIGGLDHMAIKIAVGKGTPDTDTL